MLFMLVALRFQELEIHHYHTGSLSVAWRLYVSFMFPNRMACCLLESNSALGNIANSSL